MELLQTAAAEMAQRNRDEIMAFHAHRAYERRAARGYAPARTHDGFLLTIANVLRTAAYDMRYVNGRSV